MAVQLDAVCLDLTTRNAVLTGALKVSKRRCDDKHRALVGAVRRIDALEAEVTRLKAEAELAEALSVGEHFAHAGTNATGPGAKAALPTVAVSIDPHVRPAFGAWALRGGDGIWRGA